MIISITLLDNNFELCVTPHSSKTMVKRVWFWSGPYVELRYDWWDTGGVMKYV